MMAKRHGCSGLAAAAVVLGCAAGLRGAPGSIRVWPSAVVEAPQIVVADVAELRGFDLDTAARLANLEVSVSPRAGGAALLRADDVRAALLEAGANLSNVRIFGASRCRVERPARLVEKAKRSAPRAAAAKGRARPERRSASPANAAEKERTTTLEAALRTYITAHNPDPGAKVEVRFSPVSERDLALASPPYAFEIRAQDEKAVGLLSYEVRIRRNGAPERTTPIVAEVALVKDVLVARRSINRGESIEGRALKMEPRRFTSIDGGALTDPAAAIGMVSRSLIREGELIRASQVRSRPLVTRGQRVTLWMRQGGLVIRAGGKAQQDGALGDTVEVLRDHTRRRQDLIDAVVTGPGTVTLESSQQVALGAGRDGR